MTTVPHGHRVGNRLVVFAPNWLGDAVMALPALADIRRAYPDVSLTVAARPSVLPLFTLVPFVDALLDAKGGVPGEFDEFDTAILFPNSFHSAFVAWRAGIPERWGYRTQSRGRLLTRSVAVGPRGHQAAYYQRLVADLGCPNGATDPHLDATPAARQAGAAALAAAGWDGRTSIVAFAPGAANGRAKQWPPASFAAVARQLEQDGVRTVLVGAPSDVAAGREILEAVGPGCTPINLIGRTTLPALAGVLVHCRALICNDSGAMHFGAALGVNITAMFGPSRDKETRPLGAARVTVLTHDVWCRPCMLRDCPLDHRCMTGITPDAVVSATRPSL